MVEIPSTRFEETFHFIKWAAENWELLKELYIQHYEPKEPDQAFLESSINMIETLKQESYHMCIFTFLLENMSYFSDSILTAFFHTATWLIDETRVTYFEDTLLRELRAELDTVKNNIEKIDFCDLQ